MGATPANSMDTHISSMKEILRSYDMEQLEQLKIIGATIAAEKTSRSILGKTLWEEGGALSKDFVEGRIARILQIRRWYVGQIR